jgi:hypothetical protein
MISRKSVLRFPNLDQIVVVKDPGTPCQLQASSFTLASSYHVTCAIVGYKVPAESFDKYVSHFGLDIYYLPVLQGAVADHIRSTLSTPVTLVSVDTEISIDDMLCCAVEISKSVYDCTEILATEVPPAFETLPTLIGTEGGLRRMIASEAVVCNPVRWLDG